MVTPLRVSYVGGPLDGHTRLSTDDQVPAVVATSDWEHYRLSARSKLCGRLVGVVYRHAPDLNS